MTVKIVEREAIYLVGMRVDTLLKDTREQQIIPKLQMAFNEKVGEVRGAVGLPVTYGLFIDPLGYNPEVDLFTWIAGVQAEPGMEPPAGMVSYELPQATYAVLEYKGDIDRAGEAYDELFQWINESPYEQAGTYGFELYTKLHAALERGNAEFLLHFPIRVKVVQE